MYASTAKVLRVDLSQGSLNRIIIIDGAEHRLRQNDREMAIVIDWLKSHSQISKLVDLQVEGVLYFTG